MRLAKGVGRNFSSEHLEAEFKKAYEAMFSLSFDVVVIGGNIAGLSATWEISRICDANIVIIEEHKQIGKPANSSAFTLLTP